MINKLTQTTLTERKLKIFAGVGPSGIITDLWALKRGFFKYHGSYPENFIKRIRDNFIGDEQILHVCGGIFPKNPPKDLTLDINPELKPSFVADALNMPFKSCSFENVVLDPDYDENEAKSHGYPYLPPQKVLAESVRVCKVGGLIVMLHWLAMIKPKNCARIAVIGITTGANQRIRCCSIFRKVKKELEQNE